MVTPYVVNKIAAFSGHSGSVYALENLAEGLICSAGSDKVVAMWNLNNPGDGQMLAQMPDPVYSLLHIPAQQLLLAGQASGNIHLVNLETKKEERVLGYQKGIIFKMMLSVKHRLLFSLSGDGELGVIEIPEYKLSRKLNIPGGKLRAVAINNNEDVMALGAGDGSLYVFSLPGMEPLHHFQAHQESFSVNALEFSPDGTLLLSGSRDAHMNVYDVKANFIKLDSIPAHNFAIYGIAYSPDGKLLATCSRDKHVKIWNPASMEVLVRIDNENYNGHVNSVNTLRWNHETGYLVTTGDDRSVMVWEIES